MRQTSDYLITSEAAKLLNVTPATVRQLERRGELPADRTVTGVRLFKRDDVDRVAREGANRGATA